MAAEIAEGYRSLSDRSLGKAVADFGSKDEVSPILLSMFKTTGQIDGARCKKNQNDLGFSCTYNFTPVNGSGVMLNMFPDIKA